MKTIFALLLISTAIFAQAPAKAEVKPETKKVQVVTPKKAVKKTAPVKKEKVQVITPKKAEETPAPTKMKVQVITPKK